MQCMVCFTLAANAIIQKTSEKLLLRCSETSRRKVMYNLFQVVIRLNLFVGITWHAL